MDIILLAISLSFFFFREVEPCSEPGLRAIDYAGYEALGSGVLWEDPGSGLGIRCGWHPVDENWWFLSHAQMRTMVLEYESLQNWLIFGVNVGIHIPAPWSIWDGCHRMIWGFWIKPIRIMDYLIVNHCQHGDLTIWCVFLRLQTEHAMMPWHRMAISGPKLQVPTTYKAYFSGLNFREYPYKIWPTIWY